MHLPPGTIKTLFATLLFPLHTLAQDITGLWTGHLESNGTKIPYEVVISHNKNKFTGYALMVFMVNGVENVGIKSIEVKNKNRIISLEDHDLVYHNYSTPPRRVKLISSLFLKIQGNDMTLSGSFFTRSLDFRSANKDSYTGNITLKKQNLQAQTRLITKLEELNLLSTLSFIPTKDQKAEEPVIAATVPEEPPPLTIQRQTEIVIPRHAVIKTSLPVLQPERNTDFILPSVVIPTDIAVNKTIVEEIEPKEFKKQTAAVSKKVPEKNMETPSTPQQKEIRTNPPLIAIKKTEPFQTKPVGPKEVFILPAAAALSERKTEIIRSIYFSSDSLVLNLYDNGTIDGDTVSVVLNGNVIIGRKGLSATTIRTIIKWTPEMGDSLQLVMYAENLGSIPPNTGLLIVQDGEQRDEVRFSGDMQKSSAVILRRRR